MKSFVINAVLTAATPLNVNEPDSSYKKGNTNYSPVPVAFVNGQIHSCVPGSSIRGALRRAAVEVVNGKLMAKNGGKPVMDLQEFYWHTIGGVKLSKEDAGNDFKNIADVMPFTLVESVRNRDPLMSLFGTFDPAPIAGHLQVANAICDEPQVKQMPDGGVGRPNVLLDKRSGVRSDDLCRNAEVAVMLTPDALLDWEDITAGSRKAAGMRRQVEDLEKQVKAAKRKGEDVSGYLAEIKRINADRDKEIKDGKGGASVSIQQIFGQTEFIPQGSALSQRIRVMNTNDIEMGLLLASLRCFSGTSMLGGKRNLGCGEVTVLWNIKDVATRQVVAVVEASLDNGFVIHSGEDFVNSKIKAWDDFADSAAFKTHYPTKEELKIAA